MNVILKTAVIAAAIVMFALPALADGTAPVKVSFVDIDPAAAQAKVLKTQALALKRLEFEQFAKTKVRQLNKNHIFSRSRMEITKQSDGTYRARYHQIDDSTMNVKVRRSQSGAIPYVGVLSYQEKILESTASTLEQLDKGSFAVVKIIPNRHIFSYQKGSWK
jgi:hypothetical protein